MTDVQKENGWTDVMRWVARILALVAIGLFALFLSQSGTTTISQLSLTDPQGLPVLVFLSLALVGAVIAWRWELVGGIMTTAGSVVIIGLVCIGSGIDMFLCSLYFTGPLLLAGILYLACCYRSGELRIA